MLFLISATMAGSIVLAAADAVPKFDIEPSCRAAAQQAASTDYVSVCRNTEQKARDEVARQWPQVSPADKTQCVPMATNGGRATYTELLTCLEMTRDAKRLRGRIEPTTTGQK